MNADHKSRIDKYSLMAMMNHQLIRIHSLL